MMAGNYATQTPRDLENIEDGDYEQGEFLRTKDALTNKSVFTYTSDTTGFDTGKVDSRALETAVVRLQTYPGDITGGVVGDPDKTQFYVYDMYGRGYDIGVKSSDTISSFDGTTLVVTTANDFAEASKNNKTINSSTKSRNF